MRIEMACAECGKNRFNLPDANKDSSPIVCEDCGHIVGTLADLKQKVVDEILSRASPRPA